MLLLPGQERERSGSQLLLEFYFIPVLPATLGKVGVDDVSSTPCVASAGEKVKLTGPWLDGLSRWECQSDCLWLFEPRLISSVGLYTWLTGSELYFLIC